MNLNLSPDESFISFFKEHINTLNSKYYQNKKKLDKYNLDFKTNDRALHVMFILNAFSILFKIYKLPLKYLFIFRKDIKLAITDDFSDFYTINFKQIITNSNKENVNIFFFCTSPPSKCFL